MLETSVAAEEALFAAKAKALPKLLQQRREQVEVDEGHRMLRGGFRRNREVAEFAKWRTSGDPGHRLHREKMVKRNLEKEFKQAENLFRIAIVRHVADGLRCEMPGHYISTSRCRGTPDAGYRSRQTAWAAENMASSSTTTA